MPSPVATQLTRQHRSEATAVASEVSRRVQQIALRADVGDVDGWFGRVLADLLTLVTGGFAVNRTLAARYLTEHARIEGRAVVPVRASANVERVMTALRVTGPVEFKRHMSLTGDAGRARVTMAKTLNASTSRLVLAGERDTVLGTVRASQVIVGWRRVTDADPCAFCALLASRGAMYSKTTVSFQAHDGDECTAEPLYEHEDEPSSVLDLQEQWRKATAGTSGAESVRAWRRHWEGQRANPDASQRTT